jgi:hypothetical protein
MVNKKNKLYQDLDELPIYNFHKCFKGELKFLYSDRIIANENEASETWEKLYNKYCELTFSNTSLRYYRLIGEIELLKNKQIFVPVLLDLLLKTPKEDTVDIYEELKKFGVRLNKNQDISKQIERGLKNIKGSENKLNRKVDELDRINNKPVVSLTLQEQKAKLHKILGFAIDLHNTSVSEWLAYWEEVKNIKE